MYLPRHFAVDDRETAFALIRDYAFGLLIMPGEGTAVANHLPFVLDTGRGENGTLLGHMARTNPQWRGFDGAAEALAVFQGPHAYISPTWYPDQPSVPTWNYTAVHAYGAPRIVDDGLAVLRQLVAVFEANLPQPWSADQLPDDYRDTQLKGIVAFEMPIDRFECKAKLSQNRTAANRAGAIAGLRSVGDPLSLDVAALMEQREP